MSSQQFQQNPPLASSLLSNSSSLYDQIKSKFMEQQQQLQSSNAKVVPQQYKMNTSNRQQSPALITTTQPFEQKSIATKSTANMQQFQNKPYKSSSVSGSMNVDKSITIPGLSIVSAAHQRVKEHDQIAGVYNNNTNKQLIASSINPQNVSQISTSITSTRPQSSTSSYQSSAFAVQRSASNPRLIATTNINTRQTQQYAHSRGETQQATQTSSNNPTNITDTSSITPLPSYRSNFQSYSSQQQQPPQKQMQSNDNSPPIRLHSASTFHESSLKRKCVFTSQIEHKKDTTGTALQLNNFPLEFDCSEEPPSPIRIVVVKQQKKSKNRRIQSYSTTNSPTTLTKQVSQNQVVAASNSPSPRVEPERFFPSASPSAAQQPGGPSVIAITSVSSSSAIKTQTAQTRPTEQNEEQNNSFNYQNAIIIKQSNLPQSNSQSHLQTMPAQVTVNPNQSLSSAQQQAHKQLQQYQLQQLRLQVHKLNQAATNNRATTAAAAVIASSGSGSSSNLRLKQPSIYNQTQDTILNRCGSSSGILQQNTATFQRSNPQKQQSNLRSNNNNGRLLPNQNQQSKLITNVSTATEPDLRIPTNPAAAAAAATGIKSIVIANNNSNDTAYLASLHSRNTKELNNPIPNVHFVIQEQQYEDCTHSPSLIFHDQQIPQAPQVSVSKSQLRRDLYTKRVHSTSQQPPNTYSSIGSTIITGGQQQQQQQQRQQSSPSLFLKNSRINIGGSSSTSQFLTRSFVKCTLHPGTLISMDEITETTKQSIDRYRLLNFIPFTQLKPLQFILLSKRKLIITAIRSLNIEAIETLQWEIVEAAIATTLVSALARTLLFIGQLQLAIGNVDKATYFLNQSRLACIMLKESYAMKARVYSALGNLAVVLHRHSIAVPLYKKAVQHTWEIDWADEELDLYDALGKAYFYLQDANKSAYYHARSLESAVESKESPIRKQSILLTKKLSADHLNDYLSIINARVISRLHLPTAFTSTETAATTTHTQTTLTRIPQKKLESKKSKQPDSPSKRLRKRNLSEQRLSYKPSKSFHFLAAQDDAAMNGNGQPSLTAFDENRTKQWTAEGKQKLYDCCSGIALIEQMIESNEFSFQIATPRHHNKLSTNPLLQSNEQLALASKAGQLASSTISTSTTATGSAVATPSSAHVPTSLLQSRPSTSAAHSSSNNNNNNNYTSTLGVVTYKQNASASERKFEDYKKYKMPIEKKIAVLSRESEVPLHEIISRAAHKSTTTQSNQKSSTATSTSAITVSSLNDPVRVTHESPGRCLTAFKSSPQIPLAKVKSLYNEFLAEFQ